MNTMHDAGASGRRSSDSIGGGLEGQDQRGNAQGRLRTNWVGRYEIGTAERIKIHAATISTICIAIIVGVVISMIVFLMTTRGYRASGTILVDELPLVLTGKPGDADTERQLVQTLILSIANREMKLAVERDLALPPGRIAFAGLDRRLPINGSKACANVQVAAVRNSRLGSITADSQSPEFAAQVVNAILVQLDLYNRVGGTLKAIQTLAALSKSQADSTVLQLADVSAQRIKLEQEKDQLEDYLKKGLPLENYPVFAQDATLGNLKTQLFLVESEYKAISSTSTRGARLQGKASELRSLRGQLDSYAKKLAESLRSEYAIRLSQEKDLQESKQKAAEKLDAYSQESARIAQSFGNPEQMRLIAAKSLAEGKKNGDASMIIVVNRASPPLKAYTPLLLIYLFLGVAVGAAVGCGYALMTSLADNILVSPSQIERRLGIPCLALLPARQKRSTKEGVSKGFSDEEPISEMGTLLDRLLLLTDRNALSVSGWTPVTSEQRSSETIARLAHHLAKEGRNVVVIDLHFNDPQIARILGLTIKHGLEEWLLSEEPLSAALNVVPISSQGKLAVIAPTASDGKIIWEIGRRQMASLIEKLSPDWDCVLIDAPYLMSEDSLLEMILPLYSNLILTAEYRRTRMSDLTRSCSAGRSRQWRVKGVVITGAPRQSA